VPWRRVASLWWSVLQPVTRRRTAAFPLFVNDPPIHRLARNRPAGGRDFAFLSRPLGIEKLYITNDPDGLARSREGRGSSPMSMDRAYRNTALRIVLVAMPFVAWVASLAQDKSVANIGSRRELFVDRYLIDTMSGVELRLQRPMPKEIVMRY